MWEWIEKVIIISLREEKVRREKARDELKKVGLDTAKSILEHDIEDLAKRTDLEEETIADVRKILSEEFEDN